MMHVNIDFKTQTIELLDESFKASDLLELLSNELFKSFTVKAVVDIKCDCNKKDKYDPYGWPGTFVSGGYVRSSPTDQDIHITYTTSSALEGLMKELKKILIRSNP